MATEPPHGDAPRMPASVVQIKVAPGQSLSPEDYHYMVNVRYPLLDAPLPPDRVAGLLAKVRAAMPRMTFAWVRLVQPQHGECFMFVRPVAPAARTPSDGYAGWQAAQPPQDVPHGVDAARFVSPAARMARTEYRVDGVPGGCLVFVHYLSLDSRQPQAAAPAAPAPSAVPKPQRKPSGPPAAPPPSLQQSSANVEDAALDVVPPADALEERDRRAVWDHAALRMAARTLFFDRLLGPRKHSTEPSHDDDRARADLAATVLEAEDTLRDIDTLCAARDRRTGALDRLASLGPDDPSACEAVAAYAEACGLGPLSLVPRDRP